MKNKLFKGLSLSLSANPKHLIKGSFFAAQRVFAEFGIKNRTFENNKFGSNSIKSYGLLRRYTPRNDICSAGRSMIEMLGVLAIIGVLSVGGIAGYSKAMEKFKLNKIIGEYNQLIMWILENQLSLKKLEDKTELANVIIAANVLPADWSAVTDEYLSDGKGNLVHAYVNQGKSLYNLQPRITIDFNLGGLSGDLTDKNADIFSTNFSDKLCFELFNNLVKPLHSQTIYGYVFKNHNPIIYWGDAYCGQTTGKCLNNITLTEIKEICSSCDKENERCNITIGF